MTTPKPPSDVTSTASLRGHLALVKCHSEQAERDLWNSIDLISDYVQKHQLMLELMHREQKIQRWILTGVAVVVSSQIGLWLAFAKWMFWR